MKVFAVSNSSQNFGMRITNDKMLKVVEERMGVHYSSSEIKKALGSIRKMAPDDYRLQFVRTSPHMPETIGFKIIKGEKSTPVKPLALYPYTESLVQTVQKVVSNFVK